MQRVEMKDISTSELAQGVQQFEALMETARPLARQLYPVSEEIPEELRAEFFKRLGVIVEAFIRDTGVPIAHVDALLLMIALGTYSKRVDEMRKEMKRRAEAN